MSDDPLIQDVSFELVRVRRTGPWQDHIFSVDEAIVAMMLRANYTVFRLRLPGSGLVVHYIDIPTWSAARVLITATNEGSLHLDEPTEEMVRRLRTKDSWL